jgi:hypothetical protein
MAGMANRIVIIPDDGISEADKVELRMRFETDACRWCGGLHQRECPRIRHITYNPSDERSVREVEFWGDFDWDRSTVLWPEDVL